MVSKYTPEKFDIGVLRSNGSNVGMMLVSKGNTPQWAVYDDEYLANQFFTGTPGYSNLPSEKELAIRQDSWREGFGADVYDSTQPERYNWSRGMDLRFKGMGIAGQSATQLNVANTMRQVNFADKGIETWGWDNGIYNANPWRNQSNSGISVNANTIILVEGSKSCRLYVWTAQGARPYASIYQTVGNWSDEFRGQTVIINCNIKRDDWESAGQLDFARLEVSDGVSMTSKAAAANSDWQKVSHTKTLDAAATQLNIGFGILASQGFTVNASVFVDDFTITRIQGNAVIRNLIDFKQKLYHSYNKSLFRINETNGNLTWLIATAANITDLKPYIDNNLFIAQNTSNPYSYLGTNETLTNAGAGVNTFELFETVHSSSPTLWGKDSKNTIRSTTSPTNALAWSGTTTVGSNYHAITDLLSRSGALYIMKEDMPYYLNSSGVVQTDLAPRLTVLTQGNSGKNAYTDGDKIWIPAGDQSLIEEDSGTLTWRTPALFSTNLSQLKGRISTAITDDMWLYITVDNPTDGVCYVLAGRNETIGTTTQWVWHPIAELPFGEAQTSYVSSVYQKRLWISSINGLLYYIPLFKDYGDIVNDANRNFQTNTEMLTPLLHANFKDTNKAYPKVTALLGHTYNASVFFNCYFRKFEDTGWTQLSDLVGNSSSRVATSFFPTNTYSTMLRLKFVANTAYTDKTPVLLGYNVQGILNPPRRNIYACSVKVANEVTCKDGTIDKGSYQAIIDALDELQGAQWPKTIYDIDGTARTVKALPLPAGTPRYQVTAEEKNRKQERVYNLLLQSIDLS